MSSINKTKDGGEEESSQNTPHAITITIMETSSIDSSTFRTPGVKTTTLRPTIVSSSETRDGKEGSESLLVVSGNDDNTVSVTQSTRDLLQTVTETHMGTEELPVISNINSSEDVCDQSTIQIVSKTDLDKVDEGQESEGGDETSQFCLICNKELLDVQIPVFKTLTNTTQRKVSVFLGTLVGQKLTSRKAHSDIICPKCLSLLNKLDLLEVEIRDTKEEVVNKYQETVAIRGGRARRRKPAAAKKSDFVFTKIDPDDDDEQAISMEMDETFVPKVEDLLEEEHDRREDRDSQDEEWEPEYKRSRAKREASESDPRGNPKRKRGRPRKDVSKSKDVVIIGLAANNPAGDLPEEAAGGAVSILRPKNGRMRRNRPASYKPCDLCGIIPFSDVERHMAEYHPETLVRPCVLCDQRFRTFRQLGNHVLRNHGPCLLCPVCSVTFSSAVDFIKHFDDSHTGSSASFTCVVCRNTFDSTRDYCDHMETHQAEAATLLIQEGNDEDDSLKSSLNNIGLESDPESNECKYCKKKLKTPAALKRHLLCVHGERPSFRCEICYTKFNSSGALLDHTGSHSSGVIQCPLCNQQFAKFYHLRSHCDVAHANASLFHCQYCSHKARSINTLFTHVLVHHPDKLGLERNVRCTKCGEKFYSGRELTQHKTSRHTEMVKCSYCSKTMSKYLLPAHVNEEHTKEHRSACAFCGQVFFKTVKLRNHIKRHHMRDQYSRFVCQMCGKAYITCAELQRHIAAHQNERKYKCEFCSRAYFKAGDLTYHRRTHTGERPHACNSCGAAFSRPSELTTHMARAHGLHNYTRRYHRSAAPDTVDNPAGSLDNIPCASNQSLQPVTSKTCEVNEIITEVREDGELVHVVQGEGSLEVVQTLPQESQNVQHQPLTQDEGDMQVIYVELME